MSHLRRTLAAGLTRVAVSAFFLLGLATTVSMAALPIITTQPQPQTVPAGATAMFTVVVESDSTPSYWWRRNGAPIFGAANSDTLTLSNVQVSATISVVISNASGSGVTSAPVSLTVIAPPSITSHPISRTVNADAPVSFNVTATGSAPLKYQWSLNDVNVPGAISPTLSIAHAHETNAGSYFVVVTNAYGSVTSAVATLTVNPVPTNVPPSITSHPVSRTVNANAPVSFSVTVSGSAPFQYQWRFNDADVPGALSQTLFIADAHETNAGGYAVVVTNSFGAVTSAVATLTVNPGPTGSPPSIITAPQPQTVLAGSTATFTVVAAGNSPLTYVWRRNGSNIWGAPNSDTLTLPNVRVSAAISVLVSNAVGSVIAGPAALTVNSPPLITSQPSSVTVMPGGQASFNVMVFGDAPLVYQWRFNGADIPGATGQNFVVANAQDTNEGDYTVVITNAFGSATSAVAVLTVDPTAYLHWAWARKMGGPGEQWGQALAVGRQGEAYVAGRFALATDFGGQTLSTPSGDQRDVFLARYDESGGLVWVRRAGDGQPHLYAEAAGVGVDPAGNVFVAGSVQNRTTLANTTFVNKFDAAGNLLWTRLSTSASYNIAKGLALDAAGNAYLVGMGSAAFGSNTISGSSGAFLVKFSPDGTVAWGRSLAAQTIDAIRDITVDAQTNIFVSGAIANAVNFGTGFLYPVGFDAFVAKFDSAGSNQWARRVNASGSDDGWAVGTDAAGNCYLAGGFQGVGSFGTNQFTSAGYKDAFLCKYDPSGNLLWARQVTGPDFDVSLGVIADSAGGIFMAGGIGSNVVSFGETNLTSPMWGSGFIAKYNATTGGCIWAANIGGPGSSGIYAISLQGETDLLVAGQFGYMPGLSVSFDSVTLTHEGADAFIAKLTGIDLISPPVVTNPPLVSAMSPGAGLTLRVEATGGGQMTYQWRLNGADIPGANSSTLNLPGLSLDGAGLYTVVARNALGAATNVAANLTLWSLQVTGSVAAFDIAGPAGGEYLIECTSLLPAGWAPVTNLTLLDGTARLLSTDPLHAPARFYRLKKISP